MGLFLPQGPNWDRCRPGPQWPLLSCHLRKALIPPQKHWQKPWLSIVSVDFGVPIWEILKYEGDEMIIDLRLIDHVSKIRPGSRKSHHRGHRPLRHGNYCGNGGGDNGSDDNGKHLHLHSHFLQRSHHPADPNIGCGNHGFLFLLWGLKRR